MSTETAITMFLAFIAFLGSGFLTNKLFKFFSHWHDKRTKNKPPVVFSTPPVQVTQSFHIKMSIFISAMTIVLIYGIRYFKSSATLSLDTFIEFYATLISPGPYLKGDWLNALEIGVLLFLSFMVHKLISTASTADMGELNIVAPKPTRRIRYFFIAISIVTVVLAMSLPI